MILLEPKKIEDRYIKIQQKNKRLLMNNDVLYFQYLQINNNWNFDLDQKLIKCKKIVGDINLLLNHIPSWIKDIEIHGSFYCQNNKLTSLKNCPKIISGSFNCMYNNLTSLEDGPTYVGYNYFCWNNDVKFTEEYIKSICNVKKIIIC